MSTVRKSGPLLKETKYDVVTAAMIAAVIALLLGVLTVIVIWLTNRIPTIEVDYEVETLVIPGGEPDGAPDETLNVESPDPETDDPSVAETESEVTEIQEMLDTVLEVSDRATQVAQEQFDTASENSGKPGSAKGTGRAPLGQGGGEAGFPREQRWFIQFAEGKLKTYARQLDFFKIELGAVMPDGRLIYIKNMSSPSPSKRQATSGKDEKRLYMNWQGGKRREADLALFAKAKVDAKKGLILHFYSRELEALLTRTETSFANRSVKEIRRTYFKVQPAGGGYEFVVTRQLYTQ